MSLLTPKPPIKPTPKPPIKELLPLSKRSEARTNDFRWNLLSQKDKIYRKYGIPAKEVDKFTQEVKKYGSHIGHGDSRAIEKKLNVSRRSSPNIKDRIKSDKWSRILKDPEIFKK